MVSGCVAYAWPDLSTGATYFPVVGFTLVLPNPLYLFIMFFICSRVIVTVCAFFLGFRV